MLDKKEEQLNNPEFENPERDRRIKQKSSRNF